jgi:2'-5' RNA ligase
METMRAFIAVDIGDEIRGKLDELQRKLKKVHANVRWIHPRSMHLTLAFLGDVPMEQIGMIKAVLDHTCRELPAFDIAAFGTGFFGKPKCPRVVWAGIADCPPLMKLQNRIVQGLHGTGIKYDHKPFSPHLTLGRVKGIDHPIGPLLEKIEKYHEANLGCTRIAAVELIRSELKPHGAEYIRLHRVELMEGSALPEPGGDATPAGT